MKNAFLISLVFLCSTSLWAQKKSRFNTYNKNAEKKAIQWNGSLSYGNTFFIGDLHKKSSKKYLPDVALSIRFNKEFNSKHALQFGFTAGKNSGENDYSEFLPLMTFRSQYAQAHFGYRRAISPSESKNTGKSIPQLHAILGAGYYYADAERTRTIDDQTSTINEDVWSIAIPVGLELSYYTRRDWGVLLSVHNNLYLQDDIDLYENKADNGLDNQIIVNFGLCYKFN